MVLGYLVSNRMVFMSVILRKTFHVSTSPDVSARIEDVRSRLSSRLGPAVRVTDKVILLSLLDQFESYLAKLDADKRRR